jgi:hypothetical protein
MIREVTPHFDFQLTAPAALNCKTSCGGKQLLLVS